MANINYYCLCVLTFFLISANGKPLLSFNVLNEHSFEVTISDEKPVKLEIVIANINEPVTWKNAAFRSVGGLGGVFTLKNNTVSLKKNDALNYKIVYQDNRMKMEKLTGTFVVEVVPGSKSKRSLEENSPTIQNKPNFFVKFGDWSKLPSNFDTHQNWGYPPYGPPNFKPLPPVFGRQPYPEHFEKNPFLNPHKIWYHKHHKFHHGCEHGHFGGHSDYSDYDEFNHGMGSGEAKSYSTSKTTQRTATSFTSDIMTSSATPRTTVSTTMAVADNEPNSNLFESSLNTSTIIPDIDIRFNSKS